MSIAGTVHMAAGVNPAYRQSKCRQPNLPSIGIYARAITDKVNY